MKFRVAREGNGLLGLYWLGQGTNELALNLTSQFGLRLNFGPTKKQQERITSNLLGVLQESEHLQQMSNWSLIDELMKSESADDGVVIEIAQRLCPQWFVSDSNEEE